MLPFKTNRVLVKERLRKRMAEVKTLAQFEEILAQADEDRRGSMRKMLEPMLRPGLPCCGVGMLNAVLKQNAEHHPKCPTRRKVQLV